MEALKTRPVDIISPRLAWEISQRAKSNVVSA